MDELYMKLALEEAYKAFSTYEVPVGAVVVHKGNIIGKGYNKRETLKDPTAHAEIIAIKEASETLGGWRLIDCTMYVTLEPCSMCAGAIMNSRMDRLVIGAKDPKMGCCGSVINLVDNPSFNHRVNTIFGVMEEECSKLIKDFFKQLRNKF
ncbi:MAG: tRNA adenosine(34) deaminase TadA [Tissierellia bacterium]|nr:tRNA adenosine(34) deaminase TadA [Tissierellia bacterium]